MRHNKEVHQKISEKGLGFFVHVLVFFFLLSSLRRVTVVIRIERNPVSSMKGLKIQSS